jgi:hypothetical protein
VLGVAYGSLVGILNSNLLFFLIHSYCNMDTLDMILLHIIDICDARKDPKNRREASG